jgi:SynChlorMet cassette radical SAM/SPASM protein ScmF
VPRLEAVYLYATADCNQRCRHCWVEAGHEPTPRAGPPLAPGELRRALEPARELGLEWVKVTGGEPFVRPDAIDLVEGLCADGLAVHVETNGTLLDDRLADRLAGAGVAQVAVSLDGAVAPTHDGLRCQVGAFDRAVRAIERLVARGVAVQMLFTLTRENLDELDALLERGTALGVAAFKLNVLMPVGRGGALHDAGLALPVPRLLAVATDLAARAAALPYEVTTSLPLAFAPRAELTRGGGHRCPILSLVAVLADGRVAICGLGSQRPDLVVGDLSREPLPRIWRESPGLRELRAGLPARLRGICGRCILRAACLGGCRAAACIVGGDLHAPFWLCAEAERLGLFPASRLEPAGAAAPRVGA